MMRFKNRKGQTALEWILTSTILGIGLIAAAAAVRDALTIEMVEIANATSSLNQGYSAPEVRLNGRDPSGGADDATYTIPALNYEGKTNSIVTTVTALQAGQTPGGNP